MHEKEEEADMHDLETRGDTELSQVPVDHVALSLATANYCLPQKAIIVDLGFQPLTFLI